jgi:hypothetical protein
MVGVQENAPEQWVGGARIGDALRALEGRAERQDRR